STIQRHSLNSSCLVLILLTFFLLTRPPPRSPLFPYTTLFRSLAPDSTGKTYPLGTFFGPVFLGVDPTTGFQVFACSAAPGHTANCVNGRTTTRGGPAAADYQVIGNANPDFTVGLHNKVNWGK